MQGAKRTLIGAALLWILGGAGAVWAEPGVQRIDRCNHLSAVEHSSFLVVNNLFSQGQDCLIVDSSDVTIDLGGFSINGAGTGRGITASTSVFNVTLRNGTVRGFAVGVSLGGSGNVVEDVRVVDNTDTGLFLGATSLADHVVAQGNFKFGVILSTACTMKDSLVRANGNSAISIGLSAGPGNTISGNTISSTTGTGLFASLGSTVTGNTVIDSNGIGVSVICPTNVLGNTATANLGGNLVLAGIGCNSVNNVAP